MEQFTTNFCLTLLHSLWQTGLLVLIYFVLNASVRVAPKGRRNMLYALLLVQFALSIATFFLLVLPNSLFKNPTVFSPTAYFEPAAAIMKNWSVYLAAAYSCFVLMKIIAHFYYWHKLGAINRIKPGIDLRHFTRLKAFEFGIPKIEIWLSDSVHTPFTYGFFRPVILLPVALVNQLSMDEVETLIVHELTHISNNDYLLNFLLLVADTLFFFNPFMRYIISNIKLEREKNCDWQVLQFNYSPVLYAETLLKTATVNLNKNNWQITAVSRKNELLNRIKFFTKDQNLVKMKQKFNPISYAVLIFAAFFSLFIFSDKKQPGSALADVPVLLPGYRYELPARNIPVVEKTVELETMPVIEAAEKSLSTTPLIIETKGEKTREVVAQVQPAIKATYVSNSEPVVREVVIRDEDPADQKVTTYVFKSSFINGRWVAEPVMVITETSAKDSCPPINAEAIPFNAEQ